MCAPKSGSGADRVPTTASGGLKPTAAGSFSCGLFPTPCNIGADPVANISTAHLNITWETAQLTGLAGLIGCLLLCTLPVRPRRLASDSLSLPKHELLGWLALGAALLHVVLLPVSDRRVTEHFRLTTPWYEWAGFLALAMLLALALPSCERIRGRLWSRHRNFQAWHVTIATLLVPAVAAHVVGTNRYIHGPGRVLAYLAASAVALLALLRARARAQPARRPLGFINSLAFGRHSALILSIVAASVGLLSTLLASGTPLALRQAPIARHEPLAIEFPHDKHRKVACLQCHHNFTDGRGDGSCVSCHRSGRGDLQLAAEPRFHDFCLRCHRNPPVDFERHGPVTGCTTCHVRASMGS
jgi:Class III cytochrome C family/Ferric reductase like transmembrane component